MSLDIGQFRVKPDSKIKLKDFPTVIKKDVPDNKKEREELVRELSPQLDAYQDILYADKSQKVLIVLQGMDTSGKDGTIRSVFHDIDPLGVRSQAFKAPNDNELAYDYLWRIHKEVPKAGEIVIFNRSHYEDVLVTYVKKWIDKNELERRIRHIKDFERMLTETGTHVIKLFLHISKDEQRERLQKRLDNKAKHWKFNPSDLEDRKLWDAFQDQYAYVLSETSTKECPWYVVPADSKSTRNVVVMNILLEHFKKYDLKYPVVDSTGWPTVVE